MVDLILRAARPDEATTLSALALRSKAHWGYDADFIEACRDELTVGTEDIDAGRVVVADVSGTIAGFFVLAVATPVADVEMMFVEPDQIGTGIGRALFARLVEDALALGCSKLRIEADPNAEQFYERLGAVRCGEVPSESIPGRSLPVLELELVSG